MSQSLDHMMCVNRRVEKISIPSCWINSREYLSSSDAQQILTAQLSIGIFVLMESGINDEGGDLRQ